MRRKAYAQHNWNAFRRHGRCASGARAATLRKAHSLKEGCRRQWKRLKAFFLNRRLLCASFSFVLAMQLKKEEDSFLVYTVIALYILLLTVCTIHRYFRKRREILLWMLLFFLAGFFLAGYSGSKALPAPGTPVHFSKVRILDCEERNDTFRCVFRIDSFYHRGVFYSDEAVPIGAVGNLSGTAAYFDMPKNEGAVDLRAYYAASNIVFYLKDAKLTHLQKAGFSLSSCFRKLRAALSARVDTYAVPEGAVLKAILFGDKTNLSPARKKIYQEGGISHVMAISGLHISVLAAVCTLLLKRCGCGKKIILLANTLFLLAFALFCGWTPSVARSVFMYGAAALAALCGRKNDWPTTLSVSFAAYGCLYPASLFQASSLLSYGAVTAIWLYLQMTRSLGGAPAKQAGRFRRLCFSRLLAPFSLGLFLNLFLLPVTLYFFYSCSLLSVFVNLYVIAMMTPLFVLGLTGLAVSFLYPPFAGLLFRVCGLILESFSQTASFAAYRLKGFRIAGKPPLALVIGFYLVLAAVLFFLPVIKRKYLLLLPVLLSVFLLFFHPAKNRLTMLYVGQGECSIMESKSGAVLMFDCGSSDEDALFQYTVEPYLKSRGIGRVDCVFLSHSDADHINGMEQYLEEENRSIEIGTIVITPQMAREEKMVKDFLLKAQKAGIPVQKMRAGDSLLLEDIQIRCLFPDSGWEGQDVNAGSMILSVAAGGLRFLFTGDATAEAEEKIPQAAADVLKVAHHGSKTSTSAALLAQLHPKAALISCGIDNAYGHPHREVLDRLESKGVQTFVTADCGQIDLYYDDGSCRVKCFLPTGDSVQ